jgi:hypothetical protein
MGNFGGSSEDRDERKTSSYSDQFNRNYKVKGGKVKKKNIIDKGIDFVKKGGVVGAAIGDKVSDFTNKRNLERRKKFISNYNTNVPPSERINLTDKQITSKEGLSKLKSKGYRTVVDTSRDANNSSDPQYKQTTAARMTAPTTAEVSQSAATEAASPEEDILYRKRKTKRQGKSLTIQTSPTGVTAGLTLGKRSLLGTG